MRWATASGLQVTFEDPATRRVMLRGSVGQLARAFEVDPQRYRWEQPDGRSVEYRGHDGPVHLPSHLDGVVAGVFGLDDRPIARPHLSSLDDGRSAVFAYDPSQIATLYDYPRLPNGGEGVELVAAMIELGGVVHPFDLADGREHSAYDGLPPSGPAAALAADRSPGKLSVHSHPKSDPF